MEQLPNTFFKRQGCGVETERRLLWGFKGSGDAREILDFAATCSGIEPLDVSRFASLKRGRNVDFFEIVSTDDVASHFSQLARRRDEGGDGDDARIDEEFTDLGNAADVFLSVVF